MGWKDFKTAMIENRIDDAISLFPDIGNDKMLTWFCCDFAGLPGATRVIQAILNDPRQNVEQDPIVFNKFCSAVDWKIRLKEGVDFSMLDVLLEDPRVLVKIDPKSFYDLRPEVQNYLSNHPKLTTTQVGLVELGRA